MLELILVASLSSLVAFVLALLWGNTKRRALDTAWAVAQEKQAAMQVRLAQLESAEQCFINEQDRQREALQQSQLIAEKHKAECAAMLEQREQSMQALSVARDELNQRQNQLSNLQSENVELKTRQQEKDRHYAEQLKQLDEQKSILKKEFENLANKIFEEKGKAFSEISSKSLDNLLDPFKLQMNEFRTKVEDIHHKETQTQAELRTELKQLQELNKQITLEAHELATALKGQKKMQGNWGELVLENVLDRSGLQVGKDYKREVSINTEAGRYRPDVVVYLPEKKHLVIDAKVSLNAYSRYVNADDELTRQQALKEHVLAFSNRIKELADKKYFDLPGLNSPDMVFMFVPIESAFVEALKADENLFEKALEQNVLVATPTTLLTSLNIVRQLWRFEDQNKHTAELADKASKVYDKLVSFLSSMEGVGSALDRAKVTYDKAYSQLHMGRGNLIKQASEFKKLGVAVKTELPIALTDRAELELSQSEKVDDANV